jgi:hypothetical protein
MSTPRTCVTCGWRDWPGCHGAPRLRTVETIEDGVVVDTDDLVLCPSCWREKTDAPPEVPG